MGGDWIPPRISTVEGNSRPVPGGSPIISPPLTLFPAPNARNSDPLAPNYPTTRPPERTYGAGRAAGRRVRATLGAELLDLRRGMMLALIGGGGAAASEASGNQEGKAVPRHPVRLPHERRDLSIYSNLYCCCSWQSSTGGSISIGRHWRMEEEEDDFHFFVDDDDEQAVELVHLMEAPHGRSSRRSDAPPKQICPRDHPSGDARIRADYFIDNPGYNNFQFRRRFRMRRHVFQRLVDHVEAADPYFKQKVDATGRLGLTPLQKVVAAVRILTYGVPADAVDEYVRIGESTARKSLNHFCRAVVTVFGEHYLRAPNTEDVARLLQINEERGFPGMLGSIDCIHWEWRNYPTAWKGMFTERGKHPSMILEVVASHDLWIWHTYFGLPGSCNDINVLQRSPVFSAYVRGQATPVSFTVNGHTYDMGYYLADGIYPDWPAFVKTVRHPMEMKTQHFAAVQEGCRKDIERAFGVLQSRWAVIRGPAYGWNRSQISNIMTACIIMHNMIVEDERSLAGDTNFENIGQLAAPYNNTQQRDEFVQAHHKLRNKSKHLQLQTDLIEHNWMLHGYSA